MHRESTYLLRHEGREAHVGISGKTVLLDGKQRDVSFEVEGSGRVLLIVDGRPYTVLVEPTRNGRRYVTVDGRRAELEILDERLRLLEKFSSTKADLTGLQEVRAPMPGLVVSIAVEPGDRVAAGDPLAVLEAMKMENELRSPVSGAVRSVHVRPGEAVGKAMLLLQIEPEP